MAYEDFPSIQFLGNIAFLIMDSLFVGRAFTLNMMFLLGFLTNGDQKVPQEYGLRTG